MVSLDEMMLKVRQKRNRGRKLWARRFARHAPADQPGRLERRVHLQQPQFPKPLGWHGAARFFTFDYFKRLFMLPLDTKGPPKPKRTYETIHDEKGRALLREVRNIDRRPLKEIRRKRREQIV